MTEDQRELLEEARDSIAAARLLRFLQTLRGNCSLRPALREYGQGPSTLSPLPSGSAGAEAQWRLWPTRCRVTQALPAFMQDMLSSGGLVSWSHERLDGQ